MGNLCSFPILCLLNKASYDISRDTCPGEDPREGRKRVVRINGDDIVFCGTQRFFLHWKSVVEHFGFIVNTDKTGVSHRWIELNSRSFDALRRSFVAKPVLSCLLPGSTPDDLLSQVVKGMWSLSRGVFWYVVNDLLRYEISIRQISVSSLPTRVLAQLRKRKWFRDAVIRGPAPIKVVGTSRSIPMTVGPVPRACLYPDIDKCIRRVTQKFVSFWRGKNVTPETRLVDRRQVKEFLRSGGETGQYNYALTRSRWAFVWPTPVLTFVRRVIGDRAFLSRERSEDEWIEDHPSLTTRCGFTFTRKPFAPASFPPPPSLLPLSCHLLCGNYNCQER